MIKYWYLILGSIAIVAFCIYYNASFDYYVAHDIKTDYSNELTRWSLFANCIIYSTIGLIYLLMGYNQERKIKYLGFYAIAQFWFILVITYILNLLFNDSIQINRIYIPMILSPTISFICLISSSLWSYYRK
jgi:hypothetical protein